MSTRTWAAAAFALAFSPAVLAQVMTTPPDDRRLPGASPMTGSGPAANREADGRSNTTTSPASGSGGVLANPTVPALGSGAATTNVDASTQAGTSGSNPGAAPANPTIGPPSAGSGSGSLGGTGTTGGGGLGASGAGSGGAAGGAAAGR